MGTVISCAYKREGVADGIRMTLFHFFFILCYSGMIFQLMELIVIFKKPIWNYSSFVTWCIILLEVAIKGWVHGGLRDGHGQKQCSGRHL